MTDKKVQASNPKRYRDKKTQTKTQRTELEAKTNFKHRQSDLEGYIFDIGTRASENSARITKELECYLELIYIDSCQSVIMTETPETFPDP